MDAHTQLAEIKDFHVIARASSALIRAILGKEKLNTAFMGSSILAKMDSLQDCGFFLKHERESIFGHNCKSQQNLYRPLDHFDSQAMD